MSKSAFLLAAILMAYFPEIIHAHGRLLEPASRMSAYLKGLPTPPNYNDHEMNCGGREIQHDQNGGKCGICGEQYQLTKNYERPNGVMVQHNIKTSVYLENQVIIIRLQITVSHKGYHEFKICNVQRTGGIEATQECLDATVLEDENGAKKFYNGTESTGYFEYILVLPEGLTCSHCVIQWRWKCGNDWGCDAGGCCVGCGARQEEFYGCSDVTINPRNGRNPITQPTFRTTAAPRATSPTWRYSSTVTTTTRRPTTYPTYTTRPQRVTYVSRTTAPTARTTTTTRGTYTTRTARPSSGYSYNMMYDYIRRYPSTIQGDTKIKFPGPGNTNNSPIGSRSSDDALINVVLGRHSIVISKDDLSVPVPVVDDSSPTATSDIENEITSNYKVKDRFCAACQYNCNLESNNKCYNYCPEVCKYSPAKLHFG
uniref:Chitin-binding type-4 domain-containing protein n=1 Tax=Arion vulgaris TaxID=1028688 RepID=A0A0B6ZZ67_9EUPU